MEISLLLEDFFTAPLPQVPSYIIKEGFTSEENGYDCHRHAPANSYVFQGGRPS